MAVRAPECEICAEKYDLVDHLPKNLRCGHTYCLACLKYMYEREGRLTCQLCMQLDSENPATLQPCRAYIEILDGLIIQCRTHEKTADSFCPTCCVGVCAQCQHPCQVLNVAEEAGQIHHILVDKVTAASEYLQQTSVPLQITLSNSVKNRYSNTLRDNFTLLWELYDIIQSQNQLSCARDQGRSNLTLYLYKRNIEVFCSQCNIPGRGELRSFPVPDEQSARDVLDKVMLELLKSINFCDLSPEFFQRYRQRTAETPKTLLELAQGLLTLKQPKKTVEQLPEWYCCPLCVQMLERSTGVIRVLPCTKALHAICENCANGFGSPGVTCPLDNNYYIIEVMSLTRHPPFLPPPAAVPFPVPPPIKPSNLSSYQAPAPIQLPSIFSSGKDPGTALPPFAPPANQFVLDRFVSVLPLVEMPESQYTANSRGWMISRNSNQVEAMIFSCTETVKLRGLGISNPVKRGVQMTLQFVKIYASGVAKGATVFAETPNLALVGGNSIITYYTFRAPFSVTACTIYTLKLKIAPPQGARDAIMVFRGNPFDRETWWCGPDSSYWEFYETKQVEEGEELNGQNNLSGPILRVIYSR